LSAAATRVIFALLVLLAIGVGIDNMERPLANPDEGRYSEISREMAQSGDWVTPRLNGFKYFEKPPLQYWASAVVFKALGENEYTARLYVALSGLLAVLMVAYTLRRLVSLRVALLAAGALVSSPYFFAMCGVITLDTGLTAWLTVALCAFLLAQAGPEAGRQRWMIGAWAAIALAVLSKGLVGFLFPAATIFLYCLVHRDWSLLKKVEWLRGLAVFFAISAPWFVLVSQANPEFARFFFIHEHFERFLSTSHRRYEPWYYFLPILVGGFGPWMLALFPASLGAWRLEDPKREFAWRRFALIWCAFILVFFSISKSKLPAYILPLFPPLAMLVGEWLERVDSRRLARYLVPVAVIVAAGLAAMWGAPERAKSAWTQELYAAARPYIAFGCVVLVVGLLAGAAMALARLKHAAIAIVVAAGMGFVDGVEDGYEQVSPRQSGQDVAAAMRPHLTPDARVYSVDYYDQTIPFYLGREVTLAKYVDEFEMGQRAEPTRALPTIEAWRADFLRPGRALAIMQPGLYDDVLRPAGIPMQLIHRDDRRVVVVKP